MLITLQNLINNNADSVNELTINHLCITHAHSMSNTSTQREQSQYTSQRPQKQWFGAECRAARKKYHLAKKIHKINLSTTNKINSIKASIEYKKKMNFYINKCIKKSQNKLRNMHNKDPKEYWKTLNSVDNKKQDPDIVLEDLYNFFKNLNGPSDNDAPDIDTLPIHIDKGDEILNSFKTEIEVRKCIKLLKNNKTCSNDNIINVIFGTCEADFQDNLDEFYEYTKQWKLDIYFLKSEVLVFGTRNDDEFSFKLGP